MQSHIAIPVENEAVTAELFTPETKIIASMLFCHGWTSKNTKYLPFAQDLSKKGVLTLAINLRGHGDSIYPLEKYSRKNHLSDILASLDYLKAVHAAPLIALGKSYGGYLSSIASSLRDIDVMILSQPALYPDSGFSFPNAEQIRSNPDIFRSMDEKIDSNKALSAIANFKNPLLIIESEHDEEVHDVPKLYIHASEGSKERTSIIIKDTDHPLTRPEWRADYFQKIDSWLQEQKII